MDNPTSGTEVFSPFGPYLLMFNLHQTTPRTDSKSKPKADGITKSLMGGEDSKRSSTPGISSNHTNPGKITAALKEWAIVCRALEDGRQVMLLRKGGIREYNQGFVLKQNTFLLYPTFEHQAKDSVRDDYNEKFELVMNRLLPGNKNKITSYAQAVSVRYITDYDTLKALRKYHIWTDNYVRMRMDYNPMKSLAVILLRVYKLDNPLELDVQPEWLGCKSWIPLESLTLQSKPPIHNGNFQLSTGHAVLEEPQFDMIVSDINRILG